ncbi:MAG: hypothetical protein HN384_07145 [Nitrosopumilus sp.]|nr:hypothetical protein [Nitrosopumilus sp.]
MFAESDDLEIDWIIEGQTEILISESSSTGTSITDQQIDNFVSSNDDVFTDVYDDFITNSGYMIGNNEITINSKEGQLLNQILIEQKEINRDNFFHMIKYLDRYSDGYVELAEALLDPVKEQKYQSHGISRDSYINSNLEHFLIERGYSLDNLESIPNNAFSPTKYDEIRATAAKIQNDNGGSVDLRELLPNYVKPDSKIMNNEMIRKLSEQTTNVHDSILSKPLEISINQSPDLTNTITDNLFDDFQFVNTKFENTQHVIDSLDRPQKLLEINKTYDSIILISIFTVLGLMIFGYLLYRKSLVKHTLPLVTVSPSINYVENTNNMIQSSKELFDNGSPKYAFEKFSQAIRYYYSHKLKINLDVTTETIIQLKKYDIDNVDDVNRWLLLCGQVEFVKHKSTQKEFMKALDSFSKSIS